MALSVEQQKAVADLIGVIIAHFPNEIAKLLVEDAVVINTDNYDSKMLVDATTKGLITSAKFNKDFVDFTEKLKNN